VGISLWRGEPDAVQLAKYYFLWQLGYVGLVTISLFTDFAPSESQTDTIRLAAGLHLAYSALWLAYLHQSERVSSIGEHRRLRDVLEMEIEEFTRWL
jgi:C4-dicarboxylate-specific signal transduction histidine kinase